MFDEDFGPLNEGSGSFCLFVCFESNDSHQFISLTCALPEILSRRV